MRQENIEAEALTKNPKERLCYIAGYRSCLQNLKQWLLKENNGEHISSIYDFINEMEKKNENK